MWVRQNKEYFCYSFDQIQSENIGYFYRYDKRISQYMWDQPLTLTTNLNFVEVFLLNNPFLISLETKHTSLNLFENETVASYCYLIFFAYYIRSKTTNSWRPWRYNFKPRIKCCNAYQVSFITSSSFIQRMI